MTWGTRLFPGRVATTFAPGAVGPDAADSALDAALRLMEAVYGVTLAPPGVLEMQSPATRRLVAWEGTATDQLARAAGEAAAAACQTLADHLPFAVVIVDDAARLLLANAAGTRAMQAGDTVTAVDGRIGANDPVANDLLRSAIARACASYTQSDSMPALVPLVADMPSPHIVVVSIQRSSDSRCAAVLFSDRERVNGAARIVASLFSLTPAQARLVVLVLGGHSLAQAACALRITPRTVVETWKNVRWKLRTRNDSECVRFLRAALLVAGHTPS